MARIKQSGACFLHRHIPTEKSRFARPEGAKHGWRNAIGVRIVHDRDEDLHLRSDRQTNSGARDLHPLGREFNDVRNICGAQARLSINCSRDRIGDDRLTDLAIDTPERR